MSGDLGFEAEAADMDVMRAHAEREERQRKESRRERLLADLERQEAAQAAEAMQTAPQPGQPAQNGAPAPAQGQPQQAAPEGEEPGLLRQAGRLANSLVPYPSQILGGMLDATQQVPRSLVDFSQAVGSVLPQAGIMVGPDGIRLASGEELTENSAADKLATWIEEAVPDIERREGGGGEMIRGIAQFLTGFLFTKNLPGMDKLSKAGRAGQFTSAAIRGAAADFAAFDPHEQRLSNLIEQFPALQNPVTEYLAASPDDTAVEGRVKNVLEGLGMGVITEGVMTGLRAMKAARHAKAAMEPVEAVVGELELIEQTVDVQRKAFTELLGDPEKPLIDVTPLKPSEVEVARALREGAEAGGERAAAAVPRGTRGEAGSDVMVNWSRINSPDDVKAVMQDMADAFSGEIDEARRGKMTFDEIQLGAQEVDAWDALKNRRVGSGLSPEETVAARELWGRSSRKLEELALAVEANPSEVNQIALRKMVAVHRAIQTEVIAARTETARALASWRIPAGDSLSFSGQMDELTSILHGDKSTVEIARGIRRMHQMGRIDAADAFVYGTPWAKTKEAVTQLWYFSLLSGPHTHARNLLSNASVLPLQIGERRVAAWLSQSMGSGEIASEEAGSMLFGMMQGFRDAFRISSKGMKTLAIDALEHPANARTMIAENADEFGGFWRSLATGQSGFGVGKVDERALGAFDPEKWRVSRESPIASVLSVIDTATSMPTRALAAGDEIFKTANFRMELNAQAARKAMAEVKAGTLAADDYLDRVTRLVNEPDEAMRLAAMKTAQEATFTQTPARDSRIYKALRSIGNVPVLGKIVMPFVRTPYNLGRFAFRRTPLALAMNSYRDAIRAGGADADIARAQMLTGTAILATFADLALQGRVTGEGPPDPREREQLRRQGWQPNSIVIGSEEGGDLRSFSYRGLEPFASSIGIAANTVEILSAAGDDDNPEIDELIQATSLAIANQVVSANYMQGVSNLLDAMSDPTRFGETWFERTAGAVVPTGIATVARSVDPVMREVEDMIDAMRARTPGLSTDLPPNRDAWGRAITRDSGLGRTYDILSPLYSSKWDPEPIDFELTMQDAYIGKPPKKVSFGGVSIDLSTHPGVYSEYLRLAGQEVTTGRFGEPITTSSYVSEGGTMLEELNSIVTGTHGFSSVYDMMTDGPDGGKVRYLKEVMRAYQDAARDELLDRFPEIRSEVNRKRLAKPGRYDIGLDEDQLMELRSQMP